MSDLVKKISSFAAKHPGITLAFLFGSVASGRDHSNSDVEFTYEQSKLIALMVSEAKINMNFAPVVDLDLNDENLIIYLKERCFSTEPDVVVRHAEAYVKGHEEFFVLPALKHFPGHGSSFGDTHLGFTDVTETWREEELIPYQKMIDN